MGEEGLKKDRKNGHQSEHNHEADFGPFDDCDEITIFDEADFRNAVRWGWLKDIFGEMFAINYVDKELMENLDSKKNLTPSSFNYFYSLYFQYLSKEDKLQKKFK